MIGIATTTYDLDGARIYTETDRRQDIQNRRGSRRVSRTATLDGGVSISDMGFSDGDRTLSVVVPDPTEAEIAFAEYLCRNYTAVTAALDDGVYQAAPETYKVDSGGLTLTLLISEKLSE